MAGGTKASPLKQEALAAFERGDEDAHEHLNRALSENPRDGSLIISYAAALLRSGEAKPFACIEQALSEAPDWVEGHKSLCRLKAEARDPDPMGTLEAALKRLPKHPKLWMAYLTLLGSAGRHDKAAEHTANLRKSIADLPELRLVEARHRGFARQAATAQTLLDALPEGLPDLAFEMARNAMRLGEFEKAGDLLERCLKQDPKDIGAWALAELTWRMLQSPKHEWLCPSDALFYQSSLGLSGLDLEELTFTLRALHTTRAAPLGQSVDGGTQTHGNLKLRQEPILGHLFAQIDAALREYAQCLPDVSDTHPLAPLRSREPQITASWSILLSKGGRHVPHLHDGGLVSSAAHISITHDLLLGEGALELGLPPADIPLTIRPLATFDPKPGHLALFPSFVYHSTSRFSEGERLTVAFDAV